MLFPRPQRCRSIPQSQDRANSSQQFFPLDPFNDIVICTRFKTSNFFGSMRSFAGKQHDKNIHQRRIHLNIPTDLDSATIWQHDVQQNQFGAPG